MAGEIVIGGLQLNFTDNGSTKVIEDITSLANALERIKEASKGGNLTVKAKQIDNLAESIDKIKASSVANVTQLADSIAKMSSASFPDTLSKSITAFGTSVEGVDNGAVDDVVQSINDIKQATGGGVVKEQTIVDADAFPKLGAEAKTAGVEVERVAEKASAFKHILSSTDTSKFAMIKSAFSTLVSPIRNAENAFTKFKDKLKTFASSSFANGIKDIKDNFVKLGQAMFGAHSFAGKLIKSFVRIAFYRSIRFALSSMVKGFKEGATNLYAWSDAFDRTRTFANSMDRIATSILYVKNSLGAMVAPIINAVAPTIDYLADKFVGLLNIVNEFISAFTGASTYTVAKRVATTFDDVADGAGKATKAIKSFTIGIDELNIIEDTGADGYGFGGDQKVAEDWFETKDVSNKMKDFADDVHTYVDNIRGYFDYLFSPLAWEDMKAQLDDWAGYLPTWEEGFDFWYGEIKDTIDGIGNWGADRIEDGVDAMNNFYDAVEDLWKLFKEDPLGFTIKSFESLSSVMSPFPLYLKVFDNLPKSIDDVQDDFAIIGEWATKGFAFLTPSQTLIKGWDNIKNGVSSVVKYLTDNDIETILSDIGEVVLKISDYITPFPALIKGWNDNLKNVKKTFDGIVRVVKKIATGDVSDLWSTFVGNERDSSRATDTADRWGGNVTDAFAEGAIRRIASNMGAVGVAFNSGLIKTFTGAKNTAFNGGTQVVNSEMSGMMSKKTPLMQTSSDLAYYSATTFSSNHNIEQFKSGGMNLIAGAIQGVNAKSGQLYSSIRNVVDETFKEFCKKGQMHSPSKLFEQGGEWIVEGANEGIEKLAPTTKAVISDWYSTFENLKPNVDMSNLSLPNIADIATSVSGAITASSDVTTQAMTSDLAEFFTDTLMPVIMQISDDAKRQADKSEVITLDGRRVTQSVNRQNSVNGYSFTGV